MYINVIRKHFRNVYLIGSGNNIILKEVDCEDERDETNLSLCLMGAFDTVGAEL